MRGIVFIRILSSTLASTFSSWFVVTYSEWSFQRFKIEHLGENYHINAINQVLLDHGSWLFLVPIGMLLLGIVACCRLREHSIFLEMLVQAGWLYALCAGLFAVLTWQGENLPTINLRGFSY